MGRTWAVAHLTLETQVPLDKSFRTTDKHVKGVRPLHVGARESGMKCVLILRVGTAVSGLCCPEEVRAGRPCDWPKCIPARSCGHDPKSGKAHAEERKKGEVQPCEVLHVGTVNALRHEAPHDCAIRGRRLKEARENVQVVGGVWPRVEIHVETPARGERVMEQQVVGMASSSPWMPVPYPTKMTAFAAPITDTGIRLRPRGQLALYSCRDTEALGVICPGCSGLVVQLKPFGRCEACKEFLFEVESSTVRPRALRLNCITGTATPEGEIQAFAEVPVRADQGDGTAQSETEREKSEDAASVTTDSLLPPPKRKVGLVQASYGRGRASPRRLPGLDGAGREESPGHPSSSEGPGEPGAGTVVLVGGVGGPQSVEPAGEGSLPSTRDYLPAEMYDTSDLESLSDCGDDGEIDELFHRKGWDRRPLPVLSKPQDSPMSIEDSTLRVKAPEFPRKSSPPTNFPHSTTSPALMVGMQRASLRAPKTKKPEMVKVPRHPEAIVQPGEGERDVMPPLARLQRLFSQRVAREYGWEYPYLPRDLLYEVEVLRPRWYDEFVWEKLKVPHARRYLSCSPPVSKKFKDCRADWRLGRHIHADKVLICRKEGEDVEYSVEVFDGHLKPLFLPDPRFYL